MMSDYSEASFSLDVRDASCADDLISSVVSMVAARTAPGARRADQTVIDQLSAAVRSSDPEDRGRFIEELIRRGVSKVDLIDLYIPAVARQMGDAWCVDEVSFADVTIGTARLQSILADLDRNSRASHGDGNAPQIALVIREDEYHTLGGVVAANQMRRFGVAVTLVVGSCDAEIAGSLRGRDFDAIMISASASERLEKVRDLVEKIRVHSSAPVVLGGTILDQEADVPALTGVDIATADPKEALLRCGLKTPLQGADCRAALD